ncbi:MAG TPA: hypothetical protein VJV78_22155 [Polyangiales bacterium]|nr:hypothetical protein [Polyangiales bacterium]
MRSSTSEFLRGVPMMLGALLVTVFAVDLLLAAQPALLEDLGSALRNQLTLRPGLMPSTQLLAAGLAVATVVLTSAVLLWFARAAQQAPALSFAPAWVAICLIGVVRTTAPLPPPFTTPWFLALSALLLVGGGMALRTQSTAGAAMGSLALTAPLAVLGAGYTQAMTHDREALLLASVLILAAIGVALIARLRPSERAREEIPGLEGVDIVEALFAQVERAERSEARVAELERQLTTPTRPNRARTLTR